MANAINANSMKLIGEGSYGDRTGWDTQVHALYLIDEADDVPNMATDDFLDDIVGAALEEGPVTISTRVVLTDGVVDGDDVVFVGAAGDPCEGLLCVNRGPGTDATRNLFFYIDTATGLPVILNGGNVTVTWDAGANRIGKY
jgi:hypothetical protein